MRTISFEDLEPVARSERGPFLIQFFSDTCMPCKKMEPVVKIFDDQNPDINVYRVNTMADPDLAAHFGVRGVPTLLVCQNREVLYRFTGLTPLTDIQYVFDNIEDPHFKLTGEFKKPEKKTDLLFPGVVVFLLLLFLFLFFFN